MRGVDVAGLDLDSPWLLDGESSLIVNGVEVTGFVEAELNRRFPGRAQRRAADPDGLRAALAVLQQAWAAAVQQGASMPAGSVDRCVDGEWSFAQTIRHLVLATDAWFGRAVLELEQPFHPYGQAMPEAADDGLDLSLFVTETPPYDEVLAVRAQRVAMITDFLATVTAQELATVRKNPWAPQYLETTLSCLHVILGEEWEHLRYALRDLALLDSPDRAAAD